MRVDIAEGLHHDCNQHVQEDARQQEVTDQKHRPDDHVIRSLAIVVRVKLALHDEVHCQNGIKQFVPGVFFYVFLLIATEDVEYRDEGSHDNQNDVQELFDVEKRCQDEFNEVSCLAKKPHPIEHLDPE